MAGTAQAKDFRRSMQTETSGLGSKLSRTCRTASHWRPPVLHFCKSQAICCGDSFQKSARSAPGFSVVPAGLRPFRRSWRRPRSLGRRLFTSFSALRCLLLYVAAEQLHHPFGNRAFGAVLHKLHVPVHIKHIAAAGDVVHHVGVPRLNVVPHDPNGTLGLG